MKISFKIDYRGFKKGQEFEFSDDQATVLVGNNGCGKSTLAWLVSETTGPSRVGSREKALDIANVDVGDKKFHSFNSDLGNLRHLSYFSEDTLLQVQAMHVSKGEAILLQLAKFIGDTRGTRGELETGWCLTSRTAVLHRIRQNYFAAFFPRGHE